MATKKDWNHDILFEEPEKIDLKKARYGSASDGGFFGNILNSLRGASVRSPKHKEETDHFGIRKK